MKDPREIIAANLRTLVDLQKDRGGRLTNSRAIAAASGVSKNTVQRLLRPHDEAWWPQLDSVSAVAGAFGYTIQQLLSEDFDPHDPPSLMTPVVRLELKELRLMRDALQRLAHERPDQSNDDGGGDSRDGQNGAGNLPHQGKSKRITN